MLSEFDNAWNKLALELGGPSLNPDQKIDQEKVEKLKDELERVCRKERGE